VTGAGPLVFRNFSDARAEAEAAARYAVQRLGLPDTAVLLPNNAYGRRMADLFARAVGEAGGRVVARVSYGTGAVTFKEPLRQLADGPSFSVLFVPDSHKRVALLGPHLAAAGFQAAYGARALTRTDEVQVRPVQLLGTGAWYHGELLDHGAVRYLDGAVFPVGFFAEADSAEAIRFSTRSLAAGTGRPGPFSAYAYDSALLLAGVLADERARDRQAVAGLLARLTRRHGVTATRSFSPARNPAGDPFMIAISERGFSAAP